MLFIPICTTTVEMEGWSWMHFGTALMISCIWLPGSREFLLEQTKCSLKVCPVQTTWARAQAWVQRGVPWQLGTGTCCGPGVDRCPGLGGRGEALSAAVRDEGGGTFRVAPEPEDEHPFGVGKGGQSKFSNA